MIRHRRPDEAGFAAIELSLGVAALLLPVTLVVLTLPVWSERQTAARAIAREVARSMAIGGHCDQAAARRLAESMGAGLGVDMNDTRVELDCRAGALLERDGEVTASVTVTMPAVEIPTIAAIGAWRWTAENRQPVDPYLSRP